LYTFFENVTYAAMFETSLLATLFLATSALTSVHGVKEVCINSHFVLNPMCSPMHLESNNSMQFRALKLQNIAQ
jgi:hypothetical protein